MISAQRDLVQADAPIEHRHERDRQHQRDRDADDEAGPDVDAQRPRVQSQADEADRQHHHHGLDQHLHELADRALDGLRLILNLRQRDACRQRRLDLGHRLVEQLAQADDVATLAHRHAQRDHLLALEAHGDPLRLGIAALDGGDVAQAHEADGAGLRVLRADRQFAQLRQAVELPVDAHPDIAVDRVEQAGALDRVLRIQLRDHRRQIDAQLRQLLVRDLDVDLFRPHAEQLDLGDVGHAQQHGAHVLGMASQILGAVAVA